MYDDFYDINPFDMNDDCFDMGDEVNSDLVIPDSFAQCLSYEQQVMYLYKLFTDYEKGVSPEVTITDIPGGHRITITDADHPQGQSFDVMDGESGQDGSDGQDGVSPTVTITEITNGHRVTITDADHPSGQSFDVMNGEKGDKGDRGEKGETGEPGFSPEVTITQITGGHRITITDADGTQTFDVMDGQDGQAIPPIITAQATVGSGTGTPTVTVTKSGTDEAPTYTFAFDNLKGANGSDGVSPTITVTDHTTYHHIEIVSAGGTESFDVYNGTDGQDGTDGVSPTVTVRAITGGHQVSITDAQGTQTFNVMDGTDGSDGSDGQDGVSPSVSTTAITGGTRVTITDAVGSHSFDVMNGVDGTDGTDGTDGSDGISPTVTVRSITGGHQIEIVSAGGTERFDVMDGTDGQDGATGATGPQGPTGPAGPGVASGGTAGQILAKKTGTDYDTEWINAPSGDNLTLIARFTAWGNDVFYIYKDNDGNPIIKYGSAPLIFEGSGFGFDLTVTQIFTALMSVYNITDNNLGGYTIYDGSNNQISTFSALISHLTTNFPTIPNGTNLNHVLWDFSNVVVKIVEVQPDYIATGGNLTGYGSVVTYQQFY